MWLVVSTRGFGSYQVDAFVFDKPAQTLLLLSDLFKTES
jgi:hypothetical protein